MIARIKAWFGPSKRELRETISRQQENLAIQRNTINQYVSKCLENETQLAFKDRVIEKINGDLEFIRKDYHETGRRNWELFKETQILEAKLKKLERR